MLDPLTIVDMAAQHFASPVKDLQHLNLMITAGPTREPLDPVRYITNHSSGKMGFAIAAARSAAGRERDLDQRAGIATDPAVCAAH
ncbi:bifunctional phosphopantothenoylcysteine decarboxylase/phosphopantothenate synthase [Klebsiella pneumoniae]|uniref:Bifunctional phosphopantothenoylcysteine decarboxylase/phosphopantothenate synthase n=1 Tax=Klebsiella pneumoniae TaxID=573 RepID=A0A2X3CSC8_KLEPN|nr:bifunctional phosphopantothenoylcysteine decarboxylase/phosphopantothenate synthase [Klebsiella pneumoniae]